MKPREAMSGPARSRAGLLVDRHRDEEHAIAREGLAVANDHIVEVANRHAVHVDMARRHVAESAAPSGPNYSTAPRCAVEDVIRTGCRPLGESAVERQVARLAMERDDIARAGQVEHQLELFLRGVAGDMRPVDRGVDDVRALPEKVDRRSASPSLVAGDRGGRDDHRVAWSDRVAMVAVCHPASAAIGSPWLPVTM